MKQWKCLAIIAVLAFGGCQSWGNRPPTVLSQASGNPFSGHRGYRLSTVNIDGSLLINDVALTPERRAELAGDLAALQSRFTEAAVDRCGATMGMAVDDGRADPGAFAIRPSLIRIGEVGRTSSDQSTRMTVRIFGADGSPLDVLVFYDANGGYDTGGRLRHAGTDLGRQLCAYLRHRAQG